jgi:phage shock protein E
MKVDIRFIYIIFMLLLSGACSTGYTGAEGKSLYPYLDPEKLLELVRDPDPEIWIVDVRPREAYARGHIPTARNYPSDSFMERLNEIPKRQYLVFYCESGGRAQLIIDQLEKKGYTRMLNWGGYSRWPDHLRGER